MSKVVFRSGDSAFGVVGVSLPPGVCLDANQVVAASIIHTYIAEIIRVFSLKVFCRNLKNIAYKIFKRKQLVML